MYTAVANECFADYTLNGGSPADTPFLNFPEPGASNVNGGSGWATPWGSNNVDFTPNFNENIPVFLNVDGRIICYTYGNKLYRKMSEPIQLSSDKTVQITFDLATQTSSLDNGVGIGILNDMVRFGLTSDGDSAPNYVSVYTDGVVTKSTKEVPQGNTFYTYIAEITINGVGADYIKFKAFPSGGLAPDEWDVELSYDLGIDDISSIGLLSNAYACLWSSVNISVDAMRTNIYVSQDGADDAEGTQANPFQTIGRAILKVREINADMTGDIIVHIGSGTYTLSEPINYAVEDGATNGYRIVYMGEEDMSTALSGGMEVTGFSHVSSQPYWVTDLSLNDYLYEFYINGHRAKVASSKYKYQASAVYDDPATEYEKDGLVFSNNMLPLSFDNVEGMLLSNTAEWIYNLIPIESFTQTSEEKIVTCRQPYANWYNTLLQPYHPVYFINHMSLLDEPGDFYYDKKSQKLYYYPMDGEQPSTSVGYVPVSEGLINIMGTESATINNLTFTNLIFKHGQWKRPWSEGFSVVQAENYIDNPDDYTWYSQWGLIIPAQFQVSFADGIEVKGNNFENISAVAVGFLDRVTNSYIKGNLFYDVGAAAATIGRGTHEESLNHNAINICRNITISNNLIREIGQTFQSSAAITAYYVNQCVITHNDIAYVPYTGISLGWGWGNNEPLCSDNEISFNRVDNVMHSMWDGSQIYTLGDIGGSIVKGNYTDRSDMECGGGTYYPDEGSTNVVCSGNVFDRPRISKFNWHYLGVQYTDNYVQLLKEKDSYGEINSEQRAGFSVYPERNWPPEAQAIIDAAGLEVDYNYLIDRFNSQLHPANIFKTYLPRYISDTVHITIAPGRDFITEGGAGVAYFDNTDWNAFDGYGDGPDWGGRNWTIGYDGPPEWMQFKITTDVTSDYMVILEAATLEDAACDIYMDGELVIPRGVVKGSGDWFLDTHSYVGDIHLQEGQEYILKFEFNTGAFNFDGMYLAIKGI
jgi:hypothetical protein